MVSFYSVVNLTGSQTCPKNREPAPRRVRSYFNHMTRSWACQSGGSERSAALPPPGRGEPASVRTIQRANLPFDDKLGYLGCQAGTPQAGKCKSNLYHELGENAGSIPSERLIVQVRTVYSRIIRAGLSVPIGRRLPVGRRLDSDGQDGHGAYGYTSTDACCRPKQPAGQPGGTPAPLGQLVATTACLCGASASSLARGRFRSGGESAAAAADRGTGRRRSARSAAVVGCAGALARAGELPGGNAPPGGMGLRPARSVGPPASMLAVD